MPLYEYGPILADGETGNACCQFETLQSFSEPHLSVCPQCGHAIRRVMSSFSLGAAASPAPSKGGLFSSASASPNDSSASRAARLAMKHSCGPGCSH